MRKKLSIDKNLLIIFCVTLTSIMSVSSLTPAFPKIINELNISPQSVGLLITVFTLPGVALTPVLGVLSDRYGRKRILVPSLILFGIAGGMCGFVSNFKLLLSLRFLQGIGGAALGSLNVTIIGDIYSDKELTTAMGYNSSVLSIGTATFPAIGGALAILGWNYPFMLAFLGIAVGMLVLFVLHNPEPKNKQKLRDYFQNLFVSIKNRDVIVLFIACFSTFIILYGSFLTYYPLFIAERFHATSLTIGLIFSIMSLVTAISSSQLGRLAAIFPEKTLLKISFLIYGIALAIVPFVHNLRALLIPTIIYGVAHGINIPSIITLLSERAPHEYRGAFMSTNGMILRLGQTLGPVVMGLMFTLGGISFVFLAGSALALAMFVITALFLLKKSDVTTEIGGDR